MDSTYIMIAVGVVVAIIAAVAVYYFFFTESKEAKEAREAKEAKEVKEKDAKEYVLKLFQIRKEKKPYSEFIAVEEAFYKKIAFSYVDAKEIPGGKKNRFDFSVSGNKALKIVRVFDRVLVRLCLSPASSVLSQY
jgi:H+/gluconate symporter-like permease